MRLREQLMGGNHHFMPRITHVVRHPRRTAAFKAAGDALERVSPMHRRRARRRARLTGIGAALLAVPIGIWLGRMIFADDEEEFATDWN